MAETEHDDSSKTEEPTPKRLEQGRERGQVAVSQEVKSWAILLAGAGALTLLAPSTLHGLAEIALRFVEQPETIHVDAGAARPAVMALVLKVVWSLAPVIGLLTAVAVGAGVAQSGLIWAPTKIKPDAARLSPAQGMRRLASGSALIEFVKGLAKLVTVGAVAFGLALPALKDIALFPSFLLSQLMGRAHRVALMLIVGTVAVMTVVAAADWVYQRFGFLKSMWMTKQEVRDEFKQQEGDPQIKARIRRLRVERARHRMMAAIPSADVVITNPTPIRFT